MRFIKAVLIIPVLFALQSFSSADLQTEKTDFASSVFSASPEKLQIYHCLELENRGLSLEAYQAALKAMQGVSTFIQNQDIITIADFSQSSNKKRLYVIDLRNEIILFQTYVAHGKNSGEEFATLFSNQSGCFKSSLGCYITSDAYQGEHGIALRLEGKEQGINDHAYDRAIVMHGADYVSEKFIGDHGRLGRSYGCPAVSHELASPIIDQIKGGTCLFIYSPDRKYFRYSSLMTSLDS